MNMKLTFFICIGILTLSAAILMIGSGGVQRISAEEFSINFASIGSAAEEMSGTYVFDKNHSTIGFRAKHLGLIEIPGYFRDFTGTINYDAKDVSKSSVEFMSKTTSIDTAVTARDNHLRSKDFFEVETYPEMKFKSTKITKSGKNWIITGDLTIKDVTKQISFPFNIAGFAEQRGVARMGATAQTTINRRDFNINWGGNLPNGTAAVSDEIKIDLQIEAPIQKIEAKATDDK